MKFTTNKPNLSITDLCRKLNYKPWKREGEEFSCIRSIRGGEYPRFHLFIKEKDNELELKLHLDQKKASYKGETSHSGEYDNEVVKEEMNRIKEIMGRVN